jgi:SAM-dependent methyltransferase
MNKLTDYFWNKPKQLRINKWHHYFDIYESHFNRFCGKNPTVLEIGCGGGGSLEMWNYYFDGKCQIYGVDVRPRCKQQERLFDNVNIFIGDQGNVEFWKEFKTKVPKLDILIDDGGHTMQQQIVTFEEMYSHISENGVYLCEDLHTSYWDSHGGGFKNPNSFIEYSKNLIDKINSHHIKEEQYKDLPFRHVTHSIHYYDSIVVIEKKLDRKRPFHSVKRPTPAVK